MRGASGSPKYGEFLKSSSPGDNLDYAICARDKVDEAVVTSPQPDVESTKDSASVQDRNFVRGPRRPATLFNL
jgi:hypothetical protein